MRSAAALLAGLGIMAICGACQAGQDDPVAVQPEAKAFPLGGLKLIALRDAGFVIDNDAKTFGVDAGTNAVAAVLKQAGARTDKINLAVDALVVVETGRVMLFDTGVGPDSHGVLLASLAKAGIAPGAVTDVFITHTHDDHIGGLVSPGGALAFPNAAIRMSQTEWAWLQTQPGSARQVKLFSPRLKTFTPGVAAAPGVTPVALAGHTPGHVGYEIVWGQNRLMDIGDSAHSAIVSLARPGWANGFDTDPVAGRASRLATLALLAHSHELVFAPHFPFPGVGRIEKAGDGYVWKPGLP